MHINIQTLALSDLMGQRLRLASPLLAAYDMQVDISPWKGKKCDLLVADPENVIAKRSMAIAQRRGIDIVVLGNRDEYPQFSCVPPDARVTSIVQLIRESITRTSQHLPGKPAEHEIGLHVLLEDRWRGKSVDVHYKDHVACIRPDQGLVFAHSRSELDKIRRALGAEGPGAFTLRGSRAATPDMAYMSLEAFMLMAACESGATLPDPEDKHFKLSGWPDLGNIPQLQQAMRIAARLVLLKMSFKDLARGARDTQDLHMIKACLWSFIASGLLTIDARAATPALVPSPQVAKVTQRKPQTRIWASIARTFGMAS